MEIKTIFLDRDGVINTDIGYLYKISEFEFIEGIFEVCSHFHNLGYKIIIISNQSGIGRGYYSENDFLMLNNWMLTQFENNNISILDTFYCPHTPESLCKCRKPKPGMFLEAKNKYNINMEKSWMIGDRETDIKAANLSGISNTILVKTGYHKDKSNSSSKFFSNSIKELKNLVKI